MQVDVRTPCVGYEDRDLPDGRRELRVLYPNGQLGVRHALLAVMDGVRGLGLSRDEVENVELVLAEVLNNIAIHGHPQDDDGLVEMRIVSLSGRLTCAVFDSGPPLPCSLIESAKHPGDERPYAESGFGWFLIHTLATGLDYTRQEGRNELRFDIRLGASLTAM